MRSDGSLAAGPAPWPQPLYPDRLGLAGAHVGIEVGQGPVRLSPPGDDDRPVDLTARGGVVTRREP